MLENFWYDFTVAFIGAFLGFALTLGGDRFIVHRNKKERRRMVLETLQKELEDVVSTIEEYIEECVEIPNKKASQSTIPSPFSVPVWSTLEHTGFVLDLISNRHQKAFDTIVAAYTEIELYSSFRITIDTYLNAVNSLKTIMKLCKEAIVAIRIVT